MNTIRLNAASLFTQAFMGLTSNYAQLMSGNVNGGLTLDCIKHPNEDVNKKQLDPTFTSFLTTNFASFDKNGDGIITAEEFQEYMNAMANGGLTREQLMQLCYRVGDNDNLEQILANFDKIDKNRDGKITQEEIALFNLEQEIGAMQERRPLISEKSSMSIFYSDESEADSDSLLSIL
jgi:Ca2+-binding EF-hand superfamily protein